MSIVDRTVKRVLERAKTLNARARTSRRTETLVGANQGEGRREQEEPDVYCEGGAETEPLL